MNLPRIFRHELRSLMVQLEGDVGEAFPHKEDDDTEFYTQDALKVTLKIVQEKFAEYLEEIEETFAEVIDN